MLQHAAEADRNIAADRDLQLVAVAAHGGHHDRNAVGSVADVKAVAAGLEDGPVHRVVAGAGWKRVRGVELVRHVHDTGEGGGRRRPFCRLALDVSDARIDRQRENDAQGADHHRQQHDRLSSLAWVLHDVTGAIRITAYVDIDTTPYPSSGVV